MSVQSTVQDLLRERGPLTVDELLKLTVEQSAVKTKNPKGTIRNAVANLSTVEPGADSRYVYLFDFGDDLEHDVEVVDTFTPDPNTEYPRVVEVHGEAPPQYPTWDEDEEWDEEEEEEE